MNCHRPAYKIQNGLYLGSIGDLQSFNNNGCNVVFILTEEMPDIYWNVDFEVVHCPIPDGGILEDDILDVTVERICSYLSEGLKVAVCCGSGHGRTGYIAACVLAAHYRITEPVSYIREYYCEWAIDNILQRKAVERFTERTNNK